MPALPPSLDPAALANLPIEARRELLQLLDERAARAEAKARDDERFDTGFVPNPKQVEQRAICEGDARHILAVGGSRSGKTFGFCDFIADRAIDAPGSRHLIARLHNNDVRRSILMDTWPKMMRLVHPRVDYEINKTDQLVRFAEGAEVWMAGLDDKDRVDKVLGNEYATFLLNECSQISYQSVLTIRTRLAQRCQRRDGRQLRVKGLYDLNPVGRSHWTHKEFIEGVRPDNGMPIEPGSRAHIFMNPNDNAENIAPEYLAELDALPERQRQRFLLGQYLTETPGTLWPLDRVDALRIPRSRMPQLQRICIGLDPSGSDGVGGDMQGIVGAGVGIDGNCYVFRDDSCKMPPDGWARRAVNAYDAEGADLIVAEINYGGAMVESTVRTVSPSVNIKTLHVSRGKHLRAEPVAALYEQGKVFHVCPDGQPNPLAGLEEQMGMMTTAGYQGHGSPDRLDAMVFAVTELMLGDGFDMATFIKAYS